MRFARNILLIGILFYCFSAFAADPAPVVLVRSVSDNVISALQQNKAQIKNRQVIRNIINTIAVPNFDLPGIARSVVGRNYWLAASASDKQQFITVFTRYVIDMYADALAAYSDEIVTVKPMRNYDANASRAQVYSTIGRRKGLPIDLDYRLIKLGSTWKIYDFSVDGISMVQSYQAQFAVTLQKGGLTALTQQLSTR